MITQFRIGLRLGRFELVAAVIAVAVLTVSALVVRARLDAIGVTPACWDAWFGVLNLEGGICTPLGPDSPAKAFLEINEYEAGKVMAVGFDTDMLLGGVADLANQCKVWFSESFDAQARIRELRERSS